MIMRLVTCSFFLLIAAWLAPGLRAQIFQAQATQNPAPPIVNQPPANQQSRPGPQPSTDEQKRSVSPNTPDQSSTVGNPDAPVPLKVKGKVRYFAIESFRPGIYPVAAFYDGLTMANPPKAYPREWRQGFAGFARNYGDFMASWAAAQGGKFVVASIVQEDPRYYPSRSKNVFARSLNAVRYVLVDRGDNGNARLALGNLAGALAGGFVGNAYLPDPYANASHGLRRSALALTGFATSNLADEFHPEIRRVARKLHLPLIGK